MEGKSLLALLRSLVAEHSQQPYVKILSPRAQICLLNLRRQLELWRVRVVVVVNLFCCWDNRVVAGFTHEYAIIPSD